MIEDILREGSQDFQVWYDDPQSLAIKYQARLRKKDWTTVGLTIGGKTFGDERSRFLDGKLFGLFQHSHGGRDVGGNTKEGVVLDFLEKTREKIM